ncbi:MAG: SoxR reducing system RseC family protein [Bacteroidales bacterium]|nr:SoxR reducing system RseC family protein [Bacteroidales bacterium]
MKKVDKIEHEGTVIEIGKDTITVEIVNKSACATCHAKGVCNASDESVRVIEIPYTISSLVEEYQVGEKVNVVLGSYLGISAVFLAYVLPLLLLILSIVLLPAAGLSELHTGLASLGIVAVYYIFLSLFRNRLDRVYSFSIEKYQNKKQ